MNHIKAAIEEVMGMFVDDWRLVAAVVACLVLAYSARHTSAVAPYIFVAGLAVVLLGFTCLEARK